MAQKELELIAERTRAALAAAKARGRLLGGDRGYGPAAGPDAAAAALARREAAERTAHRLVLEVERLRAEGIEGQAAMARALDERGVPTQQGRWAWTYTTVARVMSRSGCKDAAPAQRGADEVPGCSDALRRTVAAMAARPA
jgi:hypothetical protein